MIDMWDGTCPPLALIGENAMPESNNLLRIIALPIVNIKTKPFRFES